MLAMFFPNKIQFAEGMVVPQLFVLKPCLL